MKALLAHAVLSAWNVLFFTFLTPQPLAFCLKGLPDILYPRPPFFSYQHIQFILVWRSPSQFIVSDLYVYLFYVFPISLCSTRAVIVFPVPGRMCGTNEKLFKWTNEPTGKRGGDGGSQRRQWPAAPLIELAAFPYPRQGMTVLHMCRIQQLWEVQMGWIPVVVLNARGKPLPWMSLCVQGTPNIIVLWEKRGSMT